MNTLNLLKQFSVDRQKISLKDSKAPLNPETTLSSVGVTDGGELTVKDLGRQISWKTVFLIEYVRSLLNNINGGLTDVLAPVRRPDLWSYTLWYITCQRCSMGLQCNIVTCKSKFVYLTTSGITITMFQVYLCCSHDPLR